MRVNVMGIPIDNVTKQGALDELLGFLKEEKNHLVFTPNPEIILECRNDAELTRIFSSADLSLPDGVGVLWASRFEETRLTEKVGGCDLAYALFRVIKDTGHTAYLLGSSPGVAEKAKENMEKEFPGIKIIGTHDGYFKDKEEKLILKDIQSKKPDILIVGMGAPKQERWLYHHRNRLPVKISMGLGGSIEIMAGTLKRPPDFMIRMGLEWLGRLIIEPRKRARRILIKLPRFVIEVLKKRMSKNKKR